GRKVEIDAVDPEIAIGVAGKDEKVERISRAQGVAAAVGDASGGKCRAIVSIRRDVAECERRDVAARVIAGICNGNYRAAADAAKLQIARCEARVDRFT